MSSENKKVAVIGLGSMGMGIAQSLLRDGFKVIGCDVNADALARFRQAGGATAGRPSDIDPDCQIVVCVVVSAVQAEDVLFGPKGVAATLQSGALFIACSTVSPTRWPRVSTP